MNNEVTSILSAIEQGDPRAAEQLLPLVYHELRRLAAQKLAQEKPGQTLQATALVHEAYLRLVDTEKIQQWNSRGHFFAAAAEAMRRIVLDRARDKGRLKRGGAGQRVEIDLGKIPDQAQYFQVAGLAGEVGSDGHRLPPYNDLWEASHYRSEPCAHRILPSPPGTSTAAPPRSFRTISKSRTMDPSAGLARC